MASITITIDDKYISRITTAVEAVFPNWKTENPTWTMNDMITKIMKTGLSNFVKKYEKVSIEETANIAEKDLEDIT